MGAHRVVFLMVWALCVIACGSGSKMGGSAAVVPPAPPPPSSNDVESCLFECKDQTPASLPLPTTPPVQVKLEQFSYNYSIYKPKVDYLLVVDNSSSMDTLIRSVKGAILGAADSDSFPKDSRIAVMNTMIGVAPSYTKVDRSHITGYDGDDILDSEPGFLKFVNRADIVAFKAKLASHSVASFKEYVKDWPLDGCSEEWFAPKAKDDDGNPCLAAAMQSALRGGPVEAGVHAFKHLILKNQGKSLFRSGSYLNVIFISDTQDPGGYTSAVSALTGDQDTYDFAKLKSLVIAQNPGLQWVRFHAIAPKKGAACGEPYNRHESFRETYYGLATPSGGSILEFCSTVKDAPGAVIADETRNNMYSNFIKQMINISYASEPRFVLSHSVARIIQVLVNDVEVNNYKLLADGMTIEFEDLPKVGVQSIKVKFEMKP